MKTVGNMTLFFSADDPFSNWHRSTFKYREVEFNCMEQFMMFCKAKLFQDHETAAKILATDDPRAHKRLGRQVVGYDDDIWSARRLGIVTAGCYAKFSQNAELRDLLLATGETLLVEASPFDDIWGVKLSADDPRILDPKQWRGQNLLGQALSTVRERLAREYVPTPDLELTTANPFP